MARFVNDQAVLRRGDGPFRPFGGAPTLRGLLFPASEPGFTFEPWDISTLYQDRAGTTPVTAAGQSVGLRLSKDQGLRIGSEKVTNGTFDTDLSGWAVTNVVWSAGTASFTGAPSLSQSMSTTSGVTYRVTISVSGLVGGSLWLRFIGGTASNTPTFSNGTTTFLLKSNGNTALLIEQASGAITAGSIDNISVRELAGNHEVAVSDAKRGVYGWMPKTGKRNLLTYTEQFDNAVWTKDGTTVTANAVTAPDGTLTADTVSTGTSTGEHRIYQTAGSSAVHTHTIYAKAGTANFVSLSTGNATYYAVFNLSTGAVSSSVSCTPSIVSVGDGWYRLTVTGSVAMPSFFFVVNVGETAASAVPATGSTGTSKTVHLWGAQLEAGSTATAYQRVASQYDITEAGVPTCYYVQADGVDDAYVTPTITPGTDKVQVFAGMRKLSDAATGIFIEHGTNSLDPGTLYVTAPELTGASGDFRFKSRGSVNPTPVASGTMLAPTNKVITGLGDISGDTMTLRVNGTQVAQSTTDQGTGNFLAYPAYIYSRGGTSLPFNGLDFGHAVRFGPNLDAATIARAEALIARNTPGVTL